MNALTLVFVALCLFAIGYRFYGLFIARKVLAIDPNKLTPAGSEHEQPTLGGQRSDHRNGHRGFQRCSELLQFKTPVVDKYGKKVLAMVTE